MTPKEMKALVKLSRAYERGEQWLEKVCRLEEHLKEMELLGAQAEWLEGRRKQLRLQRLQAQSLMQEAGAARIQLQMLLGEVRDEYIYNILTRHYLSGHSWKQIASGIGGGNGADSIRKAASRYLKKLSIVDIAQKV